MNKEKLREALQEMRGLALVLRGEGSPEHSEDLRAIADRIEALTASQGETPVMGVFEFTPGEAAAALKVDLDRHDRHDQPAVPPTPSACTCDAINGEPHAPGCARYLTTPPAPKRWWCSQCGVFPVVIEADKIGLYHHAAGGRCGPVVEEPAERKEK